jgi:uncharacterized protein YhjY with autotransporter beta-barrel domain
MRFLLGEASLGPTGHPTNVATKKSSDKSFFVQLKALVSLVLALWLLGFGSAAQAAGNPNSGNTLFNSASPFCMECHITPPQGGRLLAANNISVIQGAIANDYGGTFTPGGTTGMGRFGATGANTLSVTQLNNLSSYFGWYVIPTTSAKAQSVSFNTATSINLSANITVGTPVSISVPSGPSHGAVSALSVDSTGASVVTTLTYTPTNGYVGADSFTYTATNIAGTSTSATVSITVNAPPAPVTSAASPNVAYGSSNNVIDLTANITGFTTGNIVIVSAPVNGTINSTTGTSVTYTPNGVPFVGGADPFTYQIVGPGGTSNTSTVSLTVGAPPPPVANATTKTVAYNSSNNAFDLTANITNPSTSVNVTVAPTHGTINSTVGNVVTYTPNALYFGADSFSYTATGPGGGPSAPAVVSITVSNPPAPTVADRTLTVPFNTAAPIDLSTSVSGVFTSVAIAAAPTNGTVNLVGNVATYTPPTGYSGAQTANNFTYTATGPGGTSAVVGTVTVTVSTLAPGASAASMTVPLNTATTLDLAPYIIGSSISGVEVTANPAHGTVTVNGTKVTFTPVNNYFGADAFSYRAYGNGVPAVSGSAVVSVTVTGRPDPTRDTSVTALIASQSETARRFSRAQISNFQSRMESLHRRNDPPEAESPSGAGASTSFNTPRPTTPAEAAAKGYVRDSAPALQANRQPSGVAYRPAASLSADPAAGLMPAQQTGAGAEAAIAAVTAALSTGGAKPSDPATLLGKAVGMAGSAAQNSTLNLAASSGDGSTSSVGDVDIWAGGSVRFGSRDAGTANGTTFTSDGVSFGADKRISDRLAVGVGFGYASDRTEIGTDGTLSNSRSTTIAAYASYQPAPNIFIDGLLGYGALRYDTERFVVPIGQFARSNRTGDFLFASVAAGYEFHTTGLLLSPYGRIDMASHRLNDVTETGAGLYALHYYSQRIPSISAALGLRFESAHETGFGYVLPRMRVEYQHDFKGEQAAAISYADQIGGTTYTVPATTSNRNSVVLGVGSDFVFGGGLRLALDYQVQRASATDTSQAIFFKLVKDLDGRGIKIPTYARNSRGFGINLDAGVTYDDNVTRSSASATRLFDTVYSFNASKPFTISLTDNWRIGLNAFAGAEKFRTYSGLDRIFGGGEAALQYRESGEFGSPIYSLFANFAADEYNSDLRDGKRLSLGVSMRKAFTDRISMYAALSKNARYARSDVFNTRDYSARVNVDYSITPESTLYMTGEYRRGDIVSTGEHTLTNLNVARVFNHDDAFTRQGLYAYRADGRTVLLTLGYNLPLGTHDSLDFSVRRVFSETSLDSNTGAGRLRYFANQFSIIYLTSF